MSKYKSLKFRPSLEFRSPPENSASTENFGSPLIMLDHIYIYIYIYKTILIFTNEDKLYPLYIYPLSGVQIGAS